MFESSRYEHASGFIEYRTELLTGIRARICPERVKRGIGAPDIPWYSEDGCPFCPGMVEKVTPVFPEGTRITVGESITFPNLYPFASYHTVTVMTGSHRIRRFSYDQIRDALMGQIQSMKGQSGYISINWNYLPSAGASLPHPHLQGLADAVPDALPMRYLNGSREHYDRFNQSWWTLLKETESGTERFLKGTRLFWYAHPVPVGEKEIRCILPGVTILDFQSSVPHFTEDLIRILEFYQDMGHGAWNMSIFFGTDKEREFFSAFAILIARINPNPLSTSDTAFMEKLHLEPVILTLPEELGALWRTNNGTS